MVASGLVAWLLRQTATEPVDTEVATDAPAALEAA
jgi:hypothetical protein